MLNIAKVKFETAFAHKAGRRPFSAVCEIRGEVLYIVAAENDQKLKKTLMRLRQRKSGVWREIMKQC